MSMLYYFFSNKEKDNAYLFDGLNITKNKEAMKHQNQYPVISLTFKDFGLQNFQISFEYYQNLIAEVFKDYNNILDHISLPEDQEKFVRLRRAEGNFTETAMALSFLSKKLYQYYNKKVIIQLIIICYILIFNYIKNLKNNILNDI